MIEFRKATIEDISELVGLRIELLKEINREDNIDVETQTGVEELLHNYFRNNLPNEKFIAWLAIDEGKIIATSGLCFYSVPPLFKKIDGNIKKMNGNIAYIMNIYTVPEHRGEGIAKRLFEKVLTEAKSLGYKKITLHATDMGQRLYIKYGFKVTDSEMILNV